MSKERVTLVHTLVLILLLALVGCTEPVPQEPPPEPTLSPTLTTAGKEPTLLPEHKAKLSPQLKQALMEPPTDENPTVVVLLRTEGTLNQAQRSALEEIGVKVRTVAGDVVAASLPLNAISNLATLDFVKYLELSGPLYPEKGSD
jgi:hypothetical protein